MIEPPTQKLLDRLSALDLGRRGELRRCRGQVKRLARDLPAFDSVWIDALLQSRRLTPFQARLLELPKPGRLAIASFVLLDQLGCGPGATTYLVRYADGQKAKPERNASGSPFSRFRFPLSVFRSDPSRQCALKLLHVPPDETGPVQRRLAALVESAGSIASPHVVVPHLLTDDDGWLVLISRFAGGATLRELLVRRGRFSAPVVLGIARQLVDGLAALESAGLVHGDICLGNARLTRHGVAVLVDGGVAPAVSPETLIRADVPPERYDAVAPERIATGLPATPVSDMYALGCLLWELLAGRPPFPTGDPLTKLAHHQTRAVPDVIEWAPETSALLAESVNAMTSADPQRRPSSFAELRDTLRPCTRSGQRRLRRFAAAFRAAAPKLPVASGPPFVKRTLLAVVLAASIAAIGASDWDVAATATRCWSQMSDLAGTLTSTRASESGKRNAEGGTTGLAFDRPRSALRRPLPAPDANGVVLLRKRGPWLWNRLLRSATKIEIRGADGTLPEIHVGERAGIEAPGAILNRVDLRADSSRGIAIRSLRLAIRNSRILRPRGGGREHVAIEWGSPGSSDGGDIVLQNVIFAETGSAVRCHSVPASVRATNVLHLGAGSLLRLEALPIPGRAIAVRLDRITQRRAGSLLDVALPQSSRPLGRIAVEVKDCVFHFAGKGAALCRLRTAFPGRFPRRLVQVSGEGSLILPGTPLAGDGSAGSQDLADDAVLVDGGLIAGPFAFAGAFTRQPADSVISRHRAPRRSSRPPGIDAGRL